MKVTSFKDVETYLYTSIILPLKNLQAPELEFGSPIRGDYGEPWILMLERTPAGRRYRRNIEIQLNTGDNKNHILATYNIRNHNLYLYEQPFRVLNALPLLGKMHDMFNRTTPFNKIILEDAYIIPKPRRQRGETFTEASEAPGYDPGWEDEVEETDDL